MPDTTPPTPPNEAPASLALGSCSLSMLASECDQLVRAAKLLDAEAITWAEGFAIRQKDGTLQWDKNYEWAQIRWMKLHNSAENLRRMAARFVKKANTADVVTAPRTPQHEGR